VSDGDSRNWAAGARAVSDGSRELGWRCRQLAGRSHAPVAAVPETQRPVSLSFSGILLSVPALTSGIRPFPYEALMQSLQHTANPVLPRWKLLIRRFTGRCGCR
jgi:hypothetical protein